ncbi:hypothetical protein EaACW_0801 [Erwinia amylovora ACW56400]|uniref:Uncharacterized protein n=3 Tax=Erwinia amylovora TaxID=552 RepID=A0A831A1T8_ERWAM|nr:hypothetical protein EaACW_0801 [Erwinia amylovora ACW56400]CBA19743.1 hypothetical protein predicted by Glimmer/Critica [Erwinia amylovora CFBP1430]CBX79646.1 hypothetical protein predicted by Glimmer/Critica [Erwinia amylovora ATCC BAA-2158]CCO77647.1 hypothetical protein BN432_0820 [Erwinia amylovora Ea356]CCO81431.1 hypothetical protein BN433_0830 [Erwinia amylovora Ea266]CCO85234.1 hypothetical protein BN434_0817 [Erwinia amylovora CFBP 2585]CCO89018.1 hypothetical protein BN435_0816 
MAPYIELAGILIVSLGKRGCGNGWGILAKQYIFNTTQIQLQSR